MGSKIKITDTSGKRLPKKPKVNDANLSFNDGLNFQTPSAPANQPVDQASQYFQSGLLISNILIPYDNVVIYSDVTTLRAINLVETTDI